MTVFCLLQAYLLQYKDQSLKRFDLAVAAVTFQDTEQDASKKNVSEEARPMSQEANTKEKHSVANACSEDIAKVVCSFKPTKLGSNKNPCNPIS
jgi:hypothetical protein